MSMLTPRLLREARALSIAVRLIPLLPRPRRQKRRHGQSQNREPRAPEERALDAGSGGGAAGLRHLAANRGREGIE